MCPVSEIIPPEYWLTTSGYRKILSISSATIGWLQVKPAWVDGFGRLVRNWSGEVVSLILGKILTTSEISTNRKYNNLYTYAYARRNDGYNTKRSSGTKIGWNVPTLKKNLLIIYFRTGLTVSRFSSWRFEIIISVLEKISDIGDQKWFSPRCSFFECYQFSTRLSLKTFLESWWSKLRRNFNRWYANGYCQGIKTTFGFLSRKGLVTMTSGW